MSIVVIVTFTAAEEQYENLEQTLKSILPETAARPGAEVIRAAGNPETGTFTIYEQWDSVESHQAYRAWSAENRDPAKLMSLLREAPGSEQLDYIF